MLGALVYRIKVIFTMCIPTSKCLSAISLETF